MLDNIFMCKLMGGCLTLSEVQFRYAGSDIVADAKQAEAELACV